MILFRDGKEIGRYKTIPAAEDVLDTLCYADVLTGIKHSYKVKVLE